MAGAVSLGETVAATVVASVPACLAAWFAYRAKHESAAANRAVNHRPPDQPSIYELALDCATDAKAARSAAEHAQGIVTEVAGEQQRHLAWHQRDEQARVDRQSALDARLDDVVERLDAGAGRFDRLERRLGIDGDDTDGET